MLRVVNLPLPAPIDLESKVRRGIPTIPRDVLLEVAKYLPFKDRVNVSLLSKAMFAQIPPRLTEVRCKNATKISALRDYLASDPERGSSVHTLILDTPKGKETGRKDGTTEWAMILKCTRSLKELSCSALRWDHLKGHVPPTLTTLRLENCNASIFDSRFLPASLHTLSLKFNHSSVPVTELFEALATLASLKTLVLQSINCDEEDDEDDEDEDEDDYEDLPVLASVRNLTFDSTHLPPALCLPRLFPNLIAFHLIESSLIDATQPDDEHILPHLVIETDQYGFDGDIPWTVRWLTYDVPISRVTATPIDASALGTLTIRMGELVGDVWASAEEAMDARLLELETLFSELWELMGLVRDAFYQSMPSDSPLMCLTLLGMDSSFKVPDDPEETAELRQELFDLAFKYLPSLRWIALGAPKCRMHLDLDIQDFAGDHAPWRWWRVTRDEDGTPVEVTEIPGWEGERIRAYLRAADATAADEFDERFIPLR